GAGRESLCRAGVLLGRAGAPDSHRGFGRASIAGRIGRLFSKQAARQPAGRGSLAPEPRACRPRRTGEARSRSGRRACRRAGAAPVVLGRLSRGTRRDRVLAGAAPPAPPAPPPPSRV